MFQLTMRYKHKYVPGNWEKTDNRSKYVPINYDDTKEIPDCSGVNKEDLLFWDLIPSVSLIEDEEAASIDDFGYALPQRSAVLPYIYHLKNFYKGCLLGHGKITREDIDIGHNIKDIIREIDDLIS